MFNRIKKLFGMTELREEVLDFSHIDSREKALAATEQGELFPILLFPEIFGGEAEEDNTVYVPPRILGEHNQIIATLARFVEQSLIDGLNVTPEYKGNSVVPSKIIIRTSKAEELGQFNPTIDVW
ncbi:hypothetical protein A9Q79_02775 [Methylophaga sp. 42_25_T18]|nr:hypothetical protein A9Q79_02775 [Methylophaga sp. 42_25_T18]